MKNRAKNRVSDGRRVRLAKVHIAVKDLGIPEEDYRDILMREWGVESSADMTDRELNELIAHFESKGWRPKGGHRRKDNEGKKNQQVWALRDKAVQTALHMDLDMKRWRGLVKKICGVEDLRWCGDAVRLKRLLAILNDMIDRGVVTWKEHGAE